VLAIVAGILVASHLKTTENLFDNRGSPKTEAMVARRRPMGRQDRIDFKIRPPDKDNAFPHGVSDRVPLRPSKWPSLGKPWQSRSVFSG